MVCENSVGWFAGMEKVLNQEKIELCDGLFDMKRIIGWCQYMLTVVK